MGKINPPRTPGNSSMWENKYSTGGVISSTILAMLKSSSRRLFSRHALRVQQYAPNIFEKLRNFRLPDGCFFHLVLTVLFFQAFCFTRHLRRPSRIPLCTPFPTFISTTAWGTHCVHFCPFLPCAPVPTKSQPTPHRRCVISRRI